jgi:hypothetical protein
MTYHTLPGYLAIILMYSQHLIDGLLRTARKHSNLESRLMLFKASTDCSFAHVHHDASIDGAMSSTMQWLGPA